MKNNNLVLEVSELNTQYRSKKKIKPFGLHDFNFTLAKGECVGIVGPNGSGKTTTIKAILELIKIQSGKIEWTYGNIWETYLKLGVELQDTSYGRKLKVTELIDVATKFQTDKEWIKKNQDMLQVDTLDKKFQEYSKGQRQKIDLLIAIARKPETLILDEVTSNLDPLAKWSVIKFLKDWKAAKKSILITSHYLEELEELCDRLIFIKDGKIIKQITMKDIKSKHGKIINYYRELYDNSN